MGKVVICIGTIGSSTFPRCKKLVDNIARADRRVGGVVIIKDKKPQSEWLNSMRIASSGFKWCLQIDEDMYLYPNALSELLRFAGKREKQGVKILNASSLLYDLFLKSKVGSLKLWSVDPLQRLEFRDVLGGDRDYAKRATKLGYKNIEIKKVLGEHDSAPTPEVAFKKYFEYTQKLRKFSNDKSAKRFNEYLRKKYLKEKTQINKKAYDGSTLGLKKELRDKSKS